MLVESQASFYDGCVIGGGPAGSTIAKKLSEFGYSVVLLEKEKFPRHNIGSSLTPGIHHWLDVLGIRDQVENSGFIKACNTLVLWGNDAPIMKELSFDRSGYHVNRGKFDEILLASAVSEGVHLKQPYFLHKFKQDETGFWKLDITYNSSRQYIKTRFLVEATGRKSIIKGTKRSYLPKTTATYAYWETSKLTIALPM